MPLLTGFANDIFISYASVDNDPDAQDVRWVSHFRKDLETALNRRLGKSVAIFFDQADLHANDELKKLLAVARASAIFLAVCSPSYVEREWTRQELKAFYEAAKDTSGPNRLVTIEVLPVDANSLPPEFENLKRTRFYTSDKETGTDFPLTPASQPQLYNERLQQLAQHLVLLLREIRGREQLPAAPNSSDDVPQPPRQVSITTEPRTTVLLAQVTDDVYDERQKVASYLEDYGIRVVPDGEYPESGSKFANAVGADLQRADLFVQLLGRVRSLKPEDLRAEGAPAKSYAQFQYDAAWRRGIPILQWRHPDIVPEKLPPVNWDRQLLQSPDVRVMGLQEFMREIRAGITRLKPRPEPKSAKRDFIFINADRSDRDFAQNLFKAFNDQACYAVMPMDDSTASAKEIEEDLAANLIDCKGLLLLYGRASLAWVRAQTRRIIKLESQREEPLRVKTIVRGPPPPKADVGVSGFNVVDWQDGTTPERIGEIVKEFGV